MADKLADGQPRVRNLISFTLCVMLVFCVILAYEASKGYQLSIGQARQNAERVGHVLADHMELTFKAVDLTMRRAAERQYLNALFGGNLGKDLQNNLQMWVDEVPQIAGLIMVDHRGRIRIAASKSHYFGWIDSETDMSRVPIFEKLKEDTDEDVEISGLLSTRLSKQFIVVGRKLSDLDGSFGGIVLTAIDPDYFFQFFSSMEMGARSNMVIFCDHGKLVIEQKPQSAPQLASWIKENYSKENPPTTATAEALQGKEVVIHEYQKVGNMPVAVGVLLNEIDFLKQWRLDRMKDLSLLGVFVLFASVLSFFALAIAKQMKRVQESEASAVLASQAKSEFLANMSHELRTPLNAIIGFSEMITSGYFGALNAKQKERIHDIHLCGNHLLQLITDILEFSKGEAGKLELQEEQMDVAMIIRESMRMMQERSRAKGIMLEIKAGEGLPPVWADRRKIRQILLNLISNAVKFTPEKGKITIGASRDYHGNVLLTVTDTGVGIAEEDIPKALSVFGQVHRTHSHEGTGLGLPLCRMFAELHGGELDLESEIGKGTTVTVMLPASRILKAA